MGQRTLQKSQEMHVQGRKVSSTNPQTYYKTMTPMEWKFGMKVLCFEFQARSEKWGI